MVSQGTSNKICIDFDEWSDWNVDLNQGGLTGKYFGAVLLLVFGVNMLLLDAMFLYSLNWFVGHVYISHNKTVNHGIDEKSFALLDASQFVLSDLESKSCKY